MISYTDAQMEQERNDPKWLVVNGVEPKIASGLIIDVMGFDDVKENIVAFSVDWKTVLKYRLRNSPAGDGYPEYKDGVSIHELKCAREDIEQKADEDKSEFDPLADGKLTYVGGISSEVINGALNTLKSLGYTWHGGELWKPPIGEQKTDEWKQADIKHLRWIHDRLTEVHGENKNVDYMIKFRQLIDSVDPAGAHRSKTIEAAMKHNKAHHWTRQEFIEELYDLGFVSMPEGDNND